MLRENIENHLYPYLLTALAETSVDWLYALLENFQFDNYINFLLV